mmetsp:Transcript_7106/g.13971  ORF Transcript_7106/g.13971 Transcript_7106/m.13971 type:complete len:169 (-) Transcript_7106:501-1007(-)
MRDEAKIILRSKDNDALELTYGDAKLSKLVETTLGDEDDGDAGDGAIEIPIPNVPTRYLTKVVEFMKHYRTEPLADITTPLDAAELQSIVTQEWYHTFIDTDHDIVCGLITAANYMEITPLLDLACLKISLDITGRDAEQIRVMFNLPTMSEQEEAKARQDHRWIFEE